MALDIQDVNSARETAAELRSTIDGGFGYKDVVRVAVRAITELNWLADRIQDEWENI